MEIDKLLISIIPPADYSHRNGFNNTDIIDNLTNADKQLVEDKLIDKLSEGSKDTLIIETLAYLGSVKSLAILYGFLESASDPEIKLTTASSIFSINGDAKLIDIAMFSFNQLEQRKDGYYIYSLSSAFYNLAKFKSPRLDDIIRGYVDHKEYLLSYNAKRSLI